jgi:hypothetical protein
MTGPPHDFGRSRSICLPSPSGRGAGGEGHRLSQDGRMLRSSDVLSPAMTLTPTLSRGEREPDGRPDRNGKTIARSTLIVMAFALVQAGGEAQAQLTKALREAAAREAAIETGFDIDESVFHQWIFGAGNKIVSTPDHLESMLTMAIAGVDRTCSLSGEQRQKLELAGHGDRKRFMDRVAEAKRAFERLRHDPDGPGEIIKYTQPLANAYAAGLYGEGSLFAKTLATTLTPEQQSRRREALLDQARFRYKAKVSLALATLDDHLGFTSDQTRRFLALILEETTPPAKKARAFDESLVDLRAAGLPAAKVLLIEESMIYLKIAGLPEAKVRAIVDEGQWKALSRIFQKARSMEEFLRSNGYLD